MSSLLVDDLRREIAAGRVLVVVGAGVSVAATAGTPEQRYASWTGLLGDGIDRCVEVASVPDGWADRRQADLASGDLESMLAVAELVASRLGAPTGGEYGRWLRETVGTLTAHDSSLLAAIRELGMAVATTNYDSLIEQVIDVPAVTWRDGARVERVVRGDEPGILHLHGHWQDPESVVLGIRSYDKVLGDAHAQAMLRALRTMRTLLFIGCGAGLEDPNFGALLRWSREVFPGSEYRHFRLCRDQDVKSLTALHPPEERLFPLSYGSGFGDLAPFLRSLRPASSAATATASRAEATAPPAMRAAAARLPALRNCFGREEALAELVAAILAAPPQPAPVLGPPGVGKSTLAIAALHDPRVAQRFGLRRFFVRCEGAGGRDALLVAAGVALALETGPGLAERLFRELEGGPALLVLDNAEVPWEAEPLPVEELLGQLAEIPGLALVGTVTGEQRPAGPRWREAIRLRPLPLEPARAAFLAVAGERHRADPHLDRLIEAVEGLPLAVDLLAHEAEAMPNLAELWRRWESERSGLLQRAGGLTPESSVEVSVRLSLQSPRMSAPALRLASLLALLPDGLSPEDLPAVLPDDGRAATALRQIGLAVAQAPRVRLLAPIREVLRRIQPPQPEDRQRLIAHFVELALSAEIVGWAGGAEVAQRLAAEQGNLETILAAAMEETDPAPAIKAAVAGAKLQQFTGLGGPALLEAALGAARKAGQASLEAECLQALGDLAQARSHYDTARTRYQDALPLFREAGDPVREANCIMSLGKIAVARSEHDAARARFQEALPLYHGAGDALGEANCILFLGMIAVARSEHDAARARFQEALPLYRGVGDPLGEANCIQGLGYIALARSEHDTARARFQEALPLYRGVGDLLGEANCILGLGDVARARSEHDTARARYDEALALYRRLGRVLGEAACIQRLGTIALARSELDAARARYQEALSLFRQVGDPLGEANCIKGFGDIALARSEHDTARARFKEALPLFRRIGDLPGEADSIQGLGDVAFNLGDTSTAAQCYREALGLCERVPEPTSIGWCHRKLARLAESPEERRAHAAAALAAWTGIERADLVAELDEELGAAAAPPPPPPASP
jgi:tetratricopeptide (TPR) repeat protein